MGGENCGHYMFGNCKFKKCCKKFIAVKNVGILIGAGMSRAALKGIQKDEIDLLLDAAYLKMIVNINTNIQKN